MSNVEESSSVKSKPVASLDSIYEPSPEPRTPKETLIHPLEFPIEFKDYGNTSKHLWHNPHEEVSPKVEPSKEWLMEVKHSSEAIRIFSPSTTIPCSLRGTIIKALYNPTIRTSIMSEFLAKHLLGNMPLVPTKNIFKSPSGLIFKCSGIIRAMPIEINETEVDLDFNINAILDFDLLIGCPSEVLSQEKPSHGSLSEEFGKTTSATHLNIPMVEHHPNNNPFEVVKFISLFVSPKLAYETKRPSSPSLEPKPCPSSHPNVVLNDGKNSMLILHNKSLRNKNSCAMDMLLSTPRSYEEHNHLSLLVYKLFRRMVVYAFVYHKYYKSCSSTVALSLQLEQ